MTWLPSSSPGCQDEEVAFVEAVEGDEGSSRQPVEDELAIARTLGVPVNEERHAPALKRVR